MATPPARMSKGFDARLCLALRADARTVFGDYATTPPESIPVGLAPEIETTYREELLVAADRLRGETLRLVALTARAMLNAVPAA